MPKVATHTLSWSEEHNSYELYSQNQASAYQLQENDKRWHAWLSAHSAFAFHGRQGQLNLLKEARKNKGEGYWYAYRRQGKHTVKRYAGRSSELTIARLENIAHLLSQPESAGQKTEVPQNPEALKKPQETPQQLASVPQLPLLEAKLHAPRLHTPLIRRQNLLARLDAGLQRKLTLLSAPAGYGKTTLISQWIAHRQTDDDFPAVAWVSLDSGDNDPVRFWRYLITASQSFQQGLGEAALLSLASMSQTPIEPLPLEIALTNFLNALTHASAKGILILEDYHVISSEQIQHMMAFFLDHLPPTLHLVLLMRGEPSLPLARLRAKAELCEFSAADLRFSHEESASFLRQISNLRLSNDFIDELNMSLDGWAAGLRLLALAMQGSRSEQEREQILSAFTASSYPNAFSQARGAQQHSVAKLSRPSLNQRGEPVQGSRRLLQDYFVNEVFNALPEPLQSFLLHTCILKRLHGSLCDVITARNDSAQLLAELERRGLFLDALDEQGAWYRYHTLFAEAMQVRARQQLGENALQTIARTASRWYAAQNQLEEAVEAALLGQDFASAAALIERLSQAERLQELHEYYTLRTWLQQLPEDELRQHPLLCLNYATALLFTCPTDHIERPTLALLEKTLELAEQGFRAEGDRARLGIIFAQRALITWRQDEIVPARAYAQQALALLPADEARWRSVSMGITGISEMNMGRLSIARTRLLEARAIGEADEQNSDFIQTNINLLAWVCFEQGLLHETAEHYRQNLVMARARQNHSDMGHALLGLTQIFYEWNQLQEAQAAVAEVLALSKQIADEEFQIWGTIYQAEILHAQKQTSQALQLLAALLAHAQPHRLPLHYRQIQSAQARLQLANGDLSAIQHWLDNRFEPSLSLLLNQPEEEQMLVARWYLALDKPHKALEILEDLQEEARKAERIHTLFKLEVLLAVAYASNRQIPKARKLLLSVLTRTQAEGYLRLFLDEGEIMAALLQASKPYARARAVAAHIQTILQAFAQESIDLTASKSPALLEPLSPQELRVLRLLASGNSTPQIAQELVVSVNTVRTQVQSIYRKLNVNNRVAASEVARHLQLL
ncbi:hypothetical protein EPA93_32120 [Ktedonosporobacter rubrisoli]|uniref:HTH luxR-type domain-containing protein n=1 Tax=Ktedonosporobacter rubrisoli TaxID=2509675 RepID=A0A4P6JY67_KTERU|nr:LuxR C-terminal-related transcriptional regulator [Ktedonosporobacter rubrisoli]QBD80370.1 hypothetical protein EPA93_32120 [Ktedonosporobacter rubrisoli]